MCQAFKNILLCLCLISSKGTREVYTKHKSHWSPAGSGPSVSLPWVTYDWSANKITATAAHACTFTEYNRRTKMSGREIHRCKYDTGHASTNFCLNCHKFEVNMHLWALGEVFYSPFHNKESTGYDDLLEWLYNWEQFFYKVLCTSTWVAFSSINTLTCAKIKVTLPIEYIWLLYKWK